MGEGIDINVDTLTIGEIEAAENLCGKSIMPIISRGDFPAAVLAALVTVVKQRDNPAFTYQDARGIRIGEIKTADGDPTTPAGEGESPSI